MKEHSGIILYCEDENVIRKTTRRMLEELGYKVIIAVNGDEALTRYQAGKDTIDVIILDNQLPGMSGYEVYVELKKINPDVRVIMCSGYTGGKEYELARKAGIRHFLPKPYTFEELSDALDDIFK
ncbi:MAG: response regulator [Spirochaetia bacterium]